MDYRLGGVPQYFFTPREDIDMRVPNEVLKCVVFLGRDHGLVVDWIGTGFLVAVQDGAFRFTYLVTANHVAEKLDGAPFKIRANRRSGEAVEIAANESGDLVWYRHPKGESIDVAVCWWQMPSRDLDLLSIQATAFLTEELAKQSNIGPGDEVLITGLFSKIRGQSQNVPIVRIGNLAMVPHGPVVPSGVGDIEAYLVEVKSLGGISGSPVFIRQTIDIPGLFRWGTNIPATAQAYSNVIHLLGLAHGHWNVDPKELNSPTVEHVEEGFNVGLAIVIPAAHILEVLHNPELSSMRKQLKEKEMEKNKGATMDSAPTGTFTKDDFERALKKATRKVAPAKG
ncbi:MAG: hypothetical protein LAO22_14650 [Acidobacteriia bacterium]|nr:hypothetical protein [Terriglobia bacterium]